MTTLKRSVLDILSKDDLVQLAKSRELGVSTASKKAVFVEALVSDSITIEEILAEQPRDSLKSICRSMNLDDSGKEKQKIIERILAGKNEESTGDFELRHWEGKTRRKKKTKTERQSEAASDKSLLLPVERSASSTPPLFNSAFLAARWETEYRTYLEEGKDAVLREKLLSWRKRGDVLNETSSESAFIAHFFQDIWGYTMQGKNPDGSYECYPQFKVSRAGQTGGAGKADLAIGFFGTKGDAAGIPQILCEFKDIKSGLDHPQNRKGNSRSPVRQAFDYLTEAKNDLAGTELVEPSWAIVTDMEEFRLYNRIRGRAQQQRFVISAPEMVGTSEAASFNRFLFYRVFCKDSLLSQRGPSYLQRLLNDQIIEEQAIEKDFYIEYKNYREFVFKTLVKANPDFTGTKGKLVRLTQRFLDRCLFIMFCEDMGVALDFPPQLLRDVLIAHSTDPFYNAEDSHPWDRMKAIFQAMRDGGAFGDHKIGRFNGGLFEELPDLENLKIPAKVFCAKNQGANGMTSILSAPLTLLYLSAKYNFGIKNAGHERMIDFYALGRIFEQSITELEIMEAEAEGRESINLLSKRKRNGVYYTPEWVTSYIVEETVGTRLKEIREQVGLSPEKTPSDDDLLQYRAFLRDKRRAAPVAGAWLNGLKDYRTILNSFSVVDPACGSGAFLIQALDYLKREREWIANEQERITGTRELADWDEVVKEILANNIYGVDLNPESVEITKLALWMHTATKGKPLSSLDTNILCGNSLVGSDFYRGRDLALFDDEAKEKINVFDWESSFKKVFMRGGFDCVVGNPPYVKLQHFKKVQIDVSDYLINAMDEKGVPKYKSVQTGNYDLYLPFIEKGLSILKQSGRMAYIAPSVWMKNDYGQGLRHLLRENKQLERWIDFKDFQIFKDVTTYTALQFFTYSENEHVAFYNAPNGSANFATIDWSSCNDTISILGLPKSGPWPFYTQVENGLITKLNEQNVHLDTVVHDISQGLISGAFWIYANQHLGINTYLHTPKEEISDKGPHEIQIEDDITISLATGDHIKRYEKVETDLSLIFPYSRDGNASLLSPGTLENEYPKTWEFLKSYENFLRSRDGGKLDDDHWYRFSRNQNLAKQPFPKLMIAGTAPSVICCVDEHGSVAANDKRVYSIFTDTVDELWYLCGVLNSPVPNYVFKRNARPKANGYYDIEKQFLAPLPIPSVSSKMKTEIASKARALQNDFSIARALRRKTEDRLLSSQCAPDVRTEKWLWADFKTASEWKQDSTVPPAYSKSQISAWSKEQSIKQNQFHLDELDALLKKGAVLSVDSTSDKISFLINGVEVVTIYDEPNCKFIAAQWRHLARTTNVTDKYTGQKLVSALLNLKKTENPNLMAGVVSLDKQIQELEAEIEQREQELNNEIYKLYKLTPDEIDLVENG